MFINEDVAGLADELLDLQALRPTDRADRKDDIGFGSEDNCLALHLVAKTRSRRVRQFGIGQADKILGLEMMKTGEGSADRNIAQFGILDAGGNAGARQSLARHREQVHALLHFVFPRILLHFHCVN